MKFNLTLNQAKMLEWGLNFPQACLVDLFCLLPTWAESEIIEGEIWYFFSKNKILEEIPTLSHNGKLDTIYRQTKELIDKDLIRFKKFGKKDYWQLSAKIKEWNFKEKNPKNENNSEKNPSEDGKKSEETSEKNPTYNNTTGDNNTNNNNIKSLKKIFKDTDFQYKLAKLFVENHNTDPTMLFFINKDGIEYTIQKQALHIDNLQRLDFYTEVQIEYIIKYSLADEFRKNQILSCAKFRRKNKDGVPYFVVMIQKVKERKETKEAKTQSTTY